MAATTIQSITFQRLDLPLTEPFAIATGTQLAANNLLVRLELQGGTVGLGEAAPFPAVSGETQQSTLQALEKLQKLIIGKDAAEWEQLALELKQADKESAAARCGVEMAVLDAYTQHLGQPLYQFFGGAGTTLFTDLTIPAHDSVEKDAEAARSIYSKGFKTIKIKTEGKNVLHDVERVKQIQQAAPGVKLIVDGNCGYSLRSALQFLEKLEEQNLKLELLEQPLPREDWHGMADLTRQSPVPICADETARSVEDVHRIMLMRLADVINIKIMKCGISESLKMVALAKKGGLKLMIGGMVESVLAMSFSTHLAAGLDGFDFVDLDTPLFIASHPFTGGFVQEGPKLTLPKDVPGHGVRLNH